MEMHTGLYTPKTFCLNPTQSLEFLVCIFSSYHIASMMPSCNNKKPQVAAAPGKGSRRVVGYASLLLPCSAFTSCWYFLYSAVMPELLLPTCHGHHFTCGTSNNAVNFKSTTYYYAFTIHHNWLT